MFRNWDKYVLKQGQIHLEIGTNIFCGNVLSRLRSRWGATVCANREAASWRLNHPSPPEVADCGSAPPRAPPEDATPKAATTNHPTRHSVAHQGPGHRAGHTGTISGPEKRNQRADRLAERLEEKRIPNRIFDRKETSNICESKIVKWRRGERMLSNLGGALASMRQASERWATDQTSNRETR